MLIQGWRFKYFNLDFIFGDKNSLTICILNQVPIGEF